MGRICSITAAILLLTVSWVCAGSFEVLAKAAHPRAQVIGDVVLLSSGLEMPAKCLHVLHVITPARGWRG